MADPEQRLQWRIRMEQYERGYRGGVASCLLDAIALSALTGEPMPEWVAKAVLDIQRRIVDGADISLDREFGLEPIKDRRIRAKRGEIARRGAEVGNAILDAHERGQAIDRLLMEDVAEALGLSLRRVEDCWAAYKRHLERLGLDPFEGR